MAEATLRCSECTSEQQRRVGSRCLQGAMPPSHVAAACIDGGLSTGVKNDLTRLGDGSWTSFSRDEAGDGGVALVVRALMLVEMRRL
jgi:hypothetical protein